MGHFRKVFKRGTLPVAVSDGQIVSIAPTAQVIDARAAAMNPGSPTPQTVEQFPTFLTIRGGFTRISTGAGITIPAGLSAFFPLIRMTVGDQQDQELAVFGITIEQTSPDVLGAGGGTGGAANVLAWGTKHGEGAGIVIGRELPTQAGAWSFGPCTVPGIEDTGNGLLTRDAQGAEIFSLTFPPGNYNDAIPYKRIYSPPLSPYVIRLGANRRVEAALVVKGSTISAQVNKNIMGFASVQLHLGLPVVYDRLRV